MLSLENLEQKAAEFGKAFVAPQQNLLIKKQDSQKKPTMSSKSKGLWDY